MRKHLKSSYLTYAAERNKSSKAFFAIALLHILFCLASFIYFAILGRARDSVLALFFVIVIPLVLLIEKSWHLKFGTPFIALLVFIAMGSTLGAGYDLYTIVPFFDTILHVVSGFLFACLGFGLMQLIIGKAENKKSFLACLLFGFAMSLAIGLMWELFEYAGTALLGQDMQEDTIINGFNSFLLSGTHSETFDVEGIVQTVIYLSNGQTVTINGYLDIGLIDTIIDMAVCFGGGVFYMIATAIDWCKSKNKRFFKAFIPQLVEKERSGEVVEGEEQTATALFKDSQAAEGELCDIQDSN
ncbi:MAG: hypothetical protein NC037_05920 [Bacteroides sp.]|nr:hypothetical protein [Bacillota bacterium]MCM1394363.1 hypothetical protein [[Eubacterium] siraeum]MCM1456041.1 hypothetical protein [Bacteroides sp.]